MSFSPFLSSGFDCFCFSYFLSDSFLSVPAVPTSSLSLSSILLQLCEWHVHSCMLVLICSIFVFICFEKECVKYHVWSSYTVYIYIFLICVTVGLCIWDLKWLPGVCVCVCVRVCVHVCVFVYVSHFSDVLCPSDNVNRLTHIHNLTHGQSFPLISQWTSIQQEACDWANNPLWTKYVK